MQLVVLADTHLRPGSSRRLPDSALRAMAGADQVLHAGDVVSRSAWEEMSALAPLTTVLGNNDHELAGLLPERHQLEVGRVRIGMVHDSGPRVGRAKRLRRWFPDCQVVVFGHSHVPVNEAGIAGQLLFNPGSPTDKRAQPHHTMGVIEVSDGRVRDARIVRV